MPYKDPQSPEARASRARAKAKYRATENGKARANADVKRYRATDIGREKQSALKKLYVQKPGVREKIYAAHKRRWETDPVYRTAHLLRNRLNKALRKAGASGSAVRDLGCSLDAFIAYIEAHPCWNPEAMTWQNHGTVWHVDHIKALGLFTDLTDPVQLAEAAHYTNLQPLLTRDHQVKTANDIRLIQEAKSFKVAA